MGLNEQFFKMSNTIFYYGLTPIQLAVYSNLVSQSGQGSGAVAVHEKDCGSMWRK